MPLQRLEHYLVLSDDIHRTRDFYCNALGMTEGFRPQLDFPGFWLYVGDVPCVHIGDWDTYVVWTKKVGIPVSARAPATGPLDHLAFNASGFDEMRKRLKTHGIPWSENSLPEIGLRQLFITDPNGLPIEINFRT